MTKRRNAWITIGVMMGMFLGALEATVVVTAMPTVISSLGGLELYSWVFTVYFLTTTVTVPLWGRLSDLYGRRLFYLAGIILFSGGSVFCGLSQSVIQLIISRAIQGSGSGALIPLGMTIIGDIYPLEQRARIQGLFSGVWGFSSIVGPLIGGLITDHLSWRWVFFVNVPFAILAGLIIVLTLVEPKITRKPRVDYAGAFLLIVALSVLFLGLDQLRTSESNASASVLLIASLVLLGFFLWVERSTDDPILPLHLFKDRIFFAAALTGLLSGMALFGALSFIPLFVQGVLGTNATQAGYALTPLMLGWVIFSIISSHLILAIGYRKTVIAGMIFLMWGFYILSHITSDVSNTKMIFLMALIGVGMGLTTVAMLIAVQNRFPRHFRGIATSTTQFFRTIGASIGIAIMGTVMAREMLFRLQQLQSPEKGRDLAYFARHPDAIVNPVTRAEIPAATLERLQDILGMALQDVFFVGFVVSVLALGSAFVVPAGSAQQLKGGEGGPPSPPYSLKPVI